MKSFSLASIIAIMFVLTGVVGAEQNPVVSQVPLLNSQIPMTISGERVELSEVDALCVVTLKWNHVLDRDLINNVSVKYTLASFTNGREYKFDGFISMPEAVGQMYKMVTGKGVSPGGYSKLYLLEKIDKCEWSSQPAR